MSSRNGRWWITFNGEIFNYQELRGELPGAWLTATDTEVLLRAIECWGVERSLERLVGMFAFGVWDTHERTLYLARDRVGEKPLVYWREGRRLAFASELKALAGLAGSRLDARAVDCYLALGYVPAPLAIFQGAAKLEPGHYLVWRDGEVSTRKYWRPDERAVWGRLATCGGLVTRLDACKQDPRAPVTNRRAGCHPAPHAVRDLVGDAVGLRLRSDVPVALALSGGVDSSVVALECARRGARVRAFTVVFDGDSTDLACARLVAQRLGLEHEIVEVEGGATSTGLENLTRYYDEPFADSSAVGAFALARAMRGRIKVLLNGDGGDEAFAGYRHYEHVALKQAVKRAAAAVGLVEATPLDRVSVYWESKALFGRRERRALMWGSHSWLPPAFSRRPEPPERRPQARMPAPHGSALQLALSEDRRVYLPGDLMFKMDIALMASGIEGRAPFVDHRLLEWSAQLPDDELVRGREKKVALRRAYRGELPDRVLDREKQGFGAPVEAWMEGPLRELAGDLLPCAALDPLVQRGVEGARRWSLMMFALWARRWKATW